MSPAAAEYTYLYSLGWRCGGGCAPGVHNCYQIRRWPVIRLTSKRIYIRAFDAVHGVDRAVIESTGQFCCAPADLQLYLSPPMPTRHRPQGADLGDLRRQAAVN
jgi:hypothetical protein